MLLNFSVFVIKIIRSNLAIGAGLSYEIVFILNKLKKRPFFSEAGLDVRFVQLQFGFLEEEFSPSILHFFFNDDLVL